MNHAAGRHELTGAGQAGTRTGVSNQASHLRGGCQPWRDDLGVANRHVGMSADLARCFGIAQPLGALLSAVPVPACARSRGTSHKSRASQPHGAAGCRRPPIRNGTDPRRLSARGRARTCRSPTIELSARRPARARLPPAAGPAGWPRRTGRRGRRGIAGVRPRPRCPWYMPRNRAPPACGVAGVPPGPRCANAAIGVAIRATTGRCRGSAPEHRPGDAGSCLVCR
jgi:hypothetical protein